MAAPDPKVRPLSEVVRELSQVDAPTITLGQLINAFGPSALAGLLLVFGLACTLPLPPGSTTVFGLPLVLLAPQLMLNQPAPWVPRRLRDRPIATATLKSPFARLIPWLKRMEAISRPRLSFVVNGPGRQLMGLICTVFALVLILPIPLGNMLPAATVSVFSLALIQRDGVIAMAGYAFAAASIGALVLAANLVAAMLRTALSAISLT